MADFDNQEVKVPTTIGMVEMTVRSTWIDKADPTLEEPPDLQLIEELSANATVLDQDGLEIKIHTADHTTLLNLGLLTTLQVQALRNFLAQFRTDIETRLLP